MANGPKTIKVKCPVCGRPVVWASDYPFRPFCSERCKLIDLGAWAVEEHRIADDGDAEDSQTDVPRMIQ